MPLWLGVFSGRTSPGPPRHRGRQVVPVGELGHPPSDHQIDRPGHVRQSLPPHASSIRPSRAATSSADPPGSTTRNSSPPVRKIGSVTRKLTRSGPGHEPQRGVPGRVPVRVVERLQVVQVDHRQLPANGRPACSASSSSAPAVEQAGQRVGPGRVGESLRRRGQLEVLRLQFLPHPFGRQDHHAERQPGFGEGVEHRAELHVQRGVGRPNPKTERPSTRPARSAGTGRQQQQQTSTT